MDPQQQEGATVKAVIKKAQDIRKAGEKQLAQDVYASPYMPTDGTAKKLCTELGPEGAIDYMRRRWAMHDSTQREEALQAQRALERHTRRQTQAARDRLMKRAGVPLGERVTIALAQARTVSDAPTSRMDADRVHGGDTVQALRPNGDLHGRCEEIIRQAVLRVEGMVDSAKLRDLSSAA